MKLSGLAGTGSGKMGSMVFATVAGQQIVRQYQPTVANPSTAGQVENRAKLKLASQLASCVSKDIAIKREGTKSSRNMFISQNYNLLVYSAGVASVNLNAVQLTKSNKGISSFAADRSSGTAIAVALNNDSREALDKVIYVAYTKETDGSLQALGNVVVSAPGADGLFAGELPYSSKATVVYAYGVKALSDKANAAFGNLQALSSENVAKLVCTMSDVQSNLSITKTAGLTIQEGEDTGDSEDEDTVLIRAIAGEHGTVTGGGRVPYGSTVTLVATPDAGYEFLGFYEEEVGVTLISDENPYTFTATQGAELHAIFRVEEGLALGNVKLNNADWVGNQTGSSPNISVKAHVTGPTTNKIAAIVVGMTMASKPQIGTEADILDSSHTIPELEAGFQVNGIPDGRYAWLVVGTDAGSGKINPALVYGYYYEYNSGE